MKQFDQALYAAVLGLSCGLTMLAIQPETTLLPQAEAQGKKWKYYGSATCAGAACHAAKKQEEKRPADEYKTWSKEDAHSKAFNTLFEDESVEMCEELDIEDPSKDMKCTKCHTTDVPKDLQGEKYDTGNGVSCDGCHGPAEGWFKDHTKAHQYEDMFKLGMWDTRNLFRRAQVCVSCHLQIDSELVDAGHPDLSFELFYHSRREPPHWYERQTWDGVRAWSVGQSVSLCDALKKLQKRLSKKKPNEDDIGLAVAQASSYAIVFRHFVTEFNKLAAKKKAKAYKAEAAFINELNTLLLKEKADPKDLLASCKKGIPLLLALGKDLATTELFNKKLVNTVFKTIANDKELKEADEFVAEQAAGALYALYNSSVTGKGPRMRKPVIKEDKIEAILVRPTVYKPDSLFDEEGLFKTELWLKRLKAASALIK